jgi:hypothetical protein
MIKKQQRKPF